MSTEIDMALPFGGAPKHESREDAQRPVERLVKLPLPDGMTRMECGPVQFGEDDWPGLFMRGDYACPMGYALENICNAIDEGRELNWERPEGTHQIGFQDQRGKAANKPTLNKRAANATPLEFRDELIRLAVFSAT